MSSPTERKLKIVLVPASHSWLKSRLTGNSGSLFFQWMTELKYDWKPFLPKAESSYFINPCPDRLCWVVPIHYKSVFSSVISEFGDAHHFDLYHLASYPSWWCLSEAQSFPPVLCHPNPSGVQAGVGVGTDIPAGWSGAGPCTWATLWCWIKQNSSYLGLLLCEKPRAFILQYKQQRY